MVSQGEAMTGSSTSRSIPKLRGNCSRRLRALLVFNLFGDSKNYAQRKAVQGAVTLARKILLQSGAGEKATAKIDNDESILRTQAP